MFFLNVQEEAEAAAIKVCEWGVYRHLVRYKQMSGSLVWCVGGVGAEEVPFRRPCPQSRSARCAYRRTAGFRSPARARQARCWSAGWLGW